VITLTNQKVCQRCGTPLFNGESQCDACTDFHPPYHSLRSWAVYRDPVRKAIHGLKYHNNLGLADFFTPMLLNLIATESWDTDLVIPVPLSRARLRSRGYNQAGVLAFPVAMSLGKRYSPNGLSRIRETPTQVSLTAEQRRQNVVRAFRANPAIVQNKRVLLIDDVVTTGSTLAECSSALVSAGASTVYCLTLARAISHADDQV